MDDYVWWFPSLPVSSRFVVLATTLTLSLLGAPWLKLRRDARAERTTSLLNRWRLFSWLHPVQGKVLKWTVMVIIALLIVLPVGSALWQSRWGTLIQGALVGLYRHLRRTA